MTFSAPRQKYGFLRFYVTGVSGFVRLACAPIGPGIGERSPAFFVAFLADAPFWCHSCPSPPFSEHFCSMATVDPLFRIAYQWRPVLRLLTGLLRAIVLQASLCHPCRTGSSPPPRSTCSNLLCRLHCSVLFNSTRVSPVPPCITRSGPTRAMI